MAARQFGFVVARALAIYCWLLAVSSALTSFGLFRAMQPSMGLMGGFILIVQILAGAFLWTTAEKFAGPIAEEAAELKRGDWVVRLAFSAIGVFLLAGAANDLTRSIAILALGSPGSAVFGNPITNIAGDVVQLLIGLWLVLTNRFTRYSIAETGIE